MEKRDFMRLAIEESCRSYREGNNGYGCVLVKDDQVVAVSHDRSVTEQDPLSHGAMNTIREGCKALGSLDLTGCSLYCTHEPCPMCAASLVSSNIGELYSGYLNKQYLYKGRPVIQLTCREVLNKSNTKVQIHEGFLNDECSHLYHQDVITEIKRLRGATDETLLHLKDESIKKRKKWFQENKRNLLHGEDPLQSAYQFILDRMNISERLAPIVSKTDKRLVFRLKNFCPTLEACKILGLDTCTVCNTVYDESAKLLVELYDPRVRFSRNYAKLRPHSPYCEEILEMD